MTHIWSAASAEARATWGGRFRWLWIALALGIEVVMLSANVEPDQFINQWNFRALCLLSVWLPAWLCADLLSLRFAASPDPHQEWTPAQFGARAAGRLGPAFLALLVWAVTLTTRLISGDQSLAHPGFLRVLLGWSTVFVASGTTYAATAALLSAASRRPRRLPIVATMALVGMLSDFLAAAWAFSGLRTATPADITLGNLAAYASTPNLWIGVAVWGSSNALNLGDWSLEKACWAAAATFLAYSLGVSALIWRIATRRHRRQHPSAGNARMPHHASGDLIPNA